MYTFPRTLLLCATVAATLAATAQRTWPMDSLMHTWPVVQVARASSVSGKGVVRAVDSENLYTKLQEDAGDFPVFADSVVIKYAELYGQPKRQEFEALLGMSEVYFPMIEKALAATALPDQLKFLPLALSALNVHASTFQGERGLWLLTYPVAMHYGLRVTPDVDERSDAIKSTEAAVHYLKDLKVQYGTWPLAIMAFTCGPANVERARLKENGVSSYRTYYPHFDAQHRDILPQFMAFLHLYARRGELGSVPLSIAFETKADTLFAEEILNFSELEKHLQIPMVQLRELNPTLTNERVNAGTRFQLPFGSEPKYAEYLTSLKNALTQKRSAEPTDGTTYVEVPRTIYHTVKTGDNLGRIADRYHVSIAQLKKWNSIRSDRIYIGKNLVIHTRDKVAAPSKPIVPNEPTNNVLPSAPILGEAYTVQAGDSLYTIAQRYPGVSVADLMQVNGITALIMPGQQINIPVAP